MVRVHFLNSGKKPECAERITATLLDLVLDLIVTYMLFYLSISATRPRGHFRQVSAASVSIRQLKDQIIGRS